MENTEIKTSLAENPEQEITEKEEVETTDVKNQIQEKLNIKEKELDTEQPEISKTKLNDDISKIENLVKLGVLNPLQGQNLMNHVIKKAYDMVNKCGNETENFEEKPVEIDKNVAFEEFNKDNPDFFKAEGRNEVLNYLKSDNIVLDKDELSGISKLVEQVEKSAIDRYLKKVAYEENLEKSNTVAKQKLQANAQNSKNDGKNFNIFTREQIGKMSGAEFAKNESLIMKQLREGLIR